MWDTRNQDCVMSVNHGHPVESLLMFPSGGLFISAGNNSINSIVGQVFKILNLHTDPIGQVTQIITLHT